MSGHTASWKTSSAVTCRDVTLWQWWRPLPQPRISGRESLCPELLLPAKPPRTASRSTLQNAWRDNEEHRGRLFENIVIFALNMCVVEQRKTAVNRGWFSARDDSLVIFQQRKILLRQKAPWNIHKNEIYRAPVCPHHPGVEETIHSIWGTLRSEEKQLCANVNVILPQTASLQLTEPV